MEKTYVLLQTYVDMGKFCYTPSSIPEAQYWEIRENVKSPLMIKVLFNQTEHLRAQKETVHNQSIKNQEQMIINDFKE